MYWVECLKSGNSVCIYLSFTWEWNKMLISGFSYVNLIKTLKTSAFCISHFPKLLQWESTSLAAIFHELCSFCWIVESAFSDLLKLKYLKKECKQFHWRISFISSWATKYAKSLPGFACFRLCHVSNMQILNDCESIIRFDILDTLSKMQEQTCKRSAMISTAQWKLSCHDAQEETIGESSIFTVFALTFEELELSDDLMYSFIYFQSSHARSWEKIECKYLLPTAD